MPCDLLLNHTAMNQVPWMSCGLLLNHTAMNQAVMIFWFLVLILFIVSSTSFINEDKD